MAAFAAEVTAATEALLDAGGARPPPAVEAGVSDRRARRAGAPGGPPPPLDERHPFCSGASSSPGRWAMSRYHRMASRGRAAAGGPCIYVTLHGAGYLVADLVLACYLLQWKGWYERGEPHTPLRIVAVRLADRAVPARPAAGEGAGRDHRHLDEQACLAVLERGEQLLVTPGGMREAQPSRDFYRLRWEGRYGFVRLAVRTGVPIVPLAVVGGAEAFPGFRLRKLSFWSPAAAAGPAAGGAGASRSRWSAGAEAARDLAWSKPHPGLAWRADPGAPYDGPEWRRQRPRRAGTGAGHGDGSGTRRGAA